MKKVFCKSKSDAFRFASISAACAFLVGIKGYTISIAADHIYFFISAPIAAFLCSYVFWRLTFKSFKDYKTLNVIALALILTVVTHYLNFVILGLGRLVWYHLTGNGADYSGQVDSLFATITYVGYFSTLISLYYFGLISYILFVLSGLYILRTTKTK